MMGYTLDEMSALDAFFDPEDVDPVNYETDEEHERRFGYGTTTTITRTRKAKTTEEAPVQTGSALSPF